MFAEAELMKEIRGAVPHEREDLFDDRFEEPDFPIGKAGGEESGDLDVTRIPVPVGELYGVMKEPFLEIILLVKPVECITESLSISSVCCRLFVIPACLPVW
jgi:hypothetical protein